MLFCGERRIVAEALCAAAGRRRGRVGAQAGHRLGGRQDCAERIGYCWRLVCPIRDLQSGACTRISLYCTVLRDRLLLCHIIIVVQGLTMIIILYVKKVGARRKL